MGISHLSRVFCKYFLLVYDLSFYSLGRIFHRAEIFIFHKAQLSNFPFVDQIFEIVCKNVSSNPRPLLTHEHFFQTNFQYTLLTSLRSPSHFTVILHMLRFLNRALPISPLHSLSHSYHSFYLSIASCNHQIHFFLLLFKQL